MFHFAVIGSMIDEPLHDNLLQLTSVGTDLSRITVFDRLELNIGYVTGFDRSRLIIKVG
jgi:hypothetical protein